jgi:hypothetical protein
MGSPVLRDLAGILFDCPAVQSFDRSAIQRIASLHSKMDEIIKKSHARQAGLPPIEQWIECPLTKVQRLVIKRFSVDYDHSNGFTQLCHHFH